MLGLFVIKFNFALLHNFVQNIIGVIFLCRFIKSFFQSRDIDYFFNAVHISFYDCFDGKLASCTVF